jgi:DNA polymerase-3 subunit delta'
MEEQPPAFYEAVRRGYLELAAADPAASAFSTRPGRKRNRQEIRRCCNPMPFSKESLLERLSAARGAGRLAHAYLFTGPSGSGKFWLAIRLGALELGCRLENAPTHPDMHIVQPESKSRRIVTEQIRILSHSIYRKPLLGRSRVALIQDADRMQIRPPTVPETLEEPPSVHSSFS